MLVEREMAQRVLPMKDSQDKEIEGHIALVYRDEVDALRDEVKLLREENDLLVKLCKEANAKMPPRFWGPPVPDETL